ncbi:flavohemoprotein, partial [Streptomyces sp. HC44]|nr:flavohemoprotein [Streptomyces scabichelini]
MDAPTTTSADNGTSGGSGEGGWFTPRNKPEPPAGGEQETTEGSRLAALRPVGRPATRDGEAAQKRIPPAKEDNPADVGATNPTSTNVPGGQPPAHRNPSETPNPPQPEPEPRVPEQRSAPA